MLMSFHSHTFSYCRWIRLNRYFRNNVSSVSLPRRPTPTKHYHRPSPPHSTRLTSRLVGPVLAIQNAVALFTEVVAPPVEALAEPLGCVAVAEAARHLDVSEDHQADIFEGTVCVYAVGGRREVDEFFRVALVRDPGVAVGAVCLLVKGCHFCQHLWRCNEKQLLYSSVVWQN